MSANRLLDAMEMTFKICHKIAERKNRDYASARDPYANFRTFGWRGVMVRLSDKWQRLLTFYNREAFAVEDESFEDTVRDMINYLAILLAVYHEEKKAEEEQLPLPLD